MSRQRKFRYQLLQLWSKVDYWSEYHQHPGGHFSYHVCTCRNFSLTIQDVLIMQLLVYSGDTIYISGVESLRFKCSSRSKSCGFHPWSSGCEFRTDFWGVGFLLQFWMWIRSRDTWGESAWGSEKNGWFCVSARGLWDPGLVASCWMWNLALPWDFMTNGEYARGGCLHQTRCHMLKFLKIHENGCKWWKMGLQVSAVHKMLANVELELQAERLGLDRNAEGNASSRLTRLSRLTIDSNILTFETPLSADRNLVHSIHDHIYKPRKNTGSFRRLDATRRT